MSSTECRLYLVSPPAIDAPRFSGQLEAAFDGGDVACLQLRLKDCDDAQVLRAAEILAPVCHRRDVPLLINDRPDLAAVGDSDGVHIGQEDATFEEARRLLGPDKVIGVTCHDSRDLAVTATEDGADYVAFGAFHRTGTKSAATRATPEILEWAADILPTPTVAIGGITPSNCPPLIRAGANFLAVVSAVWDHEHGPAAGVRAFNDAIAHTLERVPDGSDGGSSD